MRAAVELAKAGAPTVPAPLEAMMIVADHRDTLVITGNGDVLTPTTRRSPSVRAGNYAIRPAQALAENTELDASRSRASDEDRRRDLRLHQRDRHRRKTIDLA